MDTENHCGTCTMCCKLLRVNELDKPQGIWCIHVIKDAGCTIYETRPQSCKDFECIWLQSQKLEPKSSRMPVLLRPDKCKVMMTPLKTGRGVAFWPDPGYRTAWRTPPVSRIIDKFLDHGQEVIIVDGQNRTIISR